MIGKGVDVCRPNFSYGTQENHLEFISLIQVLSLNRGVTPLFLGEFAGIEEAISESVRMLRASAYVADNDMLVHLCSLPQNLKGRANMVRLTLV